MQLNATLDALNASAMVIGHTPQMSGVNSECGGRVWRVDAGMSSGVLDAEPQVCCLARLPCPPCSAGVRSTAGAPAWVHILGSAQVPGLQGCACALPRWGASGPPTC